MFLEDSIVVFPSLSHKGGEEERGTVFLPRSGSVERRKDYPTAKAAVEKHLLPRGYIIIDFYKEDESGKATMDGGDILKIAKESTVYIGRSSRTNEEGFELMRKTLEGRGWKVVGVEVGHHLHLSELARARREWDTRNQSDEIRLPLSFFMTTESAITALPDGQIIGNFLPRSGSSPSPGVTVPNKQVLAIQEEHGIAVVDLDPSSQGKTKTVLLSSDASGTKEQLEKLGWKVETAGIGDFEAMEGCVTCLSVRVRN